MSSERGEKEPRRWISMKQRLFDQPAGVLDRRIEPFQVAHGQHQRFFGR